MQTDSKKTQGNEDNTLLSAATRLKKAKQYFAQKFQSL